MKLAYPQDISSLGTFIWNTNQKTHPSFVHPAFLLDSYFLGMIDGITGWVAEVILQPHASAQRSHGQAPKLYSHDWSLWCEQPIISHLISINWGVVQGVWIMRTLLIIRKLQGFRDYLTRTRDQDQPKFLLYSIILKNLSLFFITCKMCINMVYMALYDHFPVFFTSLISPLTPCPTDWLDCKNSFLKYISHLPAKQPFPQDI